MRSLSAGALAAQQSASNTPAVSVALAGVTYSLEADNLLYVDHIEETLATRALIGLKVSPPTFFTELVEPGEGLLPSTQNLLGRKVFISWGFKTATETYRIVHAPMWIVDFNYKSKPGEGLLEISCIGLWELLRGSRVLRAPSEIGAAPPVWPNDTTVFNILKEILEGTVISSSEARGDLFLDEDDGIINVYMPYYEAGSQEDALTIIRNLLDMTESYIRLRDDGFHIVHPVEGDPKDYEYLLNLTGDGDHPFYERSFKGRIAVPNRVVYVDRYPTGDVITGGEQANFVGVAEDSFSVGRLGNLDFIVADTILSDSEARDRAELILRQIQSEGLTATLTVPMNIGQELYDTVRVVDYRVPMALTGFVGSIRRFVSPGVYRMALTLGGLAPHLTRSFDFAPTIPAPPTTPDFDLRERIPPVEPVFGPPLPPHLLPVIPHNPPIVDSAHHLSTAPSSKTPGALPGRARKAHWQINGELAVGNQQGGIVRVSPSSWYLRSIWAILLSAPTGGDVTLRLSVRKHDEPTWNTILNPVVTIPAGSVDHDKLAVFVPAYIVLPQGALLRLDILTIGDPVPGTDLSVELDFDSRIAGR